MDLDFYSSRNRVRHLVARLAGLARNWHRRDPQDSLAELGELHAALCQDVVNEQIDLECLYEAERPRKRGAP